MDDKIVVHMRDKRPVWAMPDWVERQIRAALPDGWSVAVPNQLTDGSGDGACSVAPAVLNVVRDARIYMGYGIPAEVLRAGSMLEWVHSGAAGVDESLTREMIESEVVFTNSAGIHGPPIAETVLAMLLHFYRGFDFAEEGRRRRTWWTKPFLAARSPVRELAGSVVGILGYGGVGKEVAGRLAALGARVLALRRSANTEPRRETFAELLRGPRGLNEILDLSDAVVVCLPETKETRALVDEDFFRRMKRGSVFVNVGRGRIVDEDALIRYLQSGHLRGAALDVTRTEPLPVAHPLWEAPNLLITPHVSAVTRRFWRRETDLILDNLERFFKGMPLRNRVDKEAGY